MGDALRRGMIPVMGIWDDGTSDLIWLDSGDAGQCGKHEARPRSIKRHHPSACAMFGDCDEATLGRLVH